MLFSCLSYFLSQSLRLSPFISVSLSTHGPVLHRSLLLCYHDDHNPSRRCSGDLAGSRSHTRILRDSSHSETSPVTCYRLMISHAEMKALWHSVMVFHIQRRSELIAEGGRGEFGFLWKLGCLDVFALFAFLFQIFLCVLSVLEKFKCSSVFWVCSISILCCSRWPGVIPDCVRAFQAANVCVCVCF